MIMEYLSEKSYTLCCKGLKDEGQRKSLLYFQVAVSMVRVGIDSWRNRPLADQLKRSCHSPGHFP